MLMRWNFTAAFSRFDRIRSAIWRGQVAAPEQLHFAAVCPDKIARGGAVSGHLAFQELEPPSRLAFAIVNEFDRGVPGQRPAQDRPGNRADRLIDVIFAIVLAADRPSETNRFDRAGTGFRVALGLNRLRIDRLSLNRDRFRLAMGCRLIEDAGDGRERIIGRVAVAQTSTSGYEGASTKTCWRR